MLTSPRLKARCYYYKKLGHTLLHREALATSPFKQIFTVRQMASHRIEGSQHQDRGPSKRLFLSRMYKNVNVKKPVCTETYYMPGIVICALTCNCIPSSQQLCEEDTVTALI